MSSKSVAALSKACVGKLPIEDEAILYSSSSICLNAHMEEHRRHDSINYRVFCILACGGFVITDRVDALERDFADSVVFTDGFDDLRQKIDFYLTSREETVSYREAGMDKVLTKHTYRQRANDLVVWLDQII
jgi:spore maturation protein CgeB